MAGLSTEVRNHPVLLSELNRRAREGEEFTAPQSTTNQKSKNGIVPFAVQQQRPALVGGEPVAQSHTNSAYALDSADTGGKFWAKQAGISCLVRDSSNRGQTEVDRCGSEVTLFQVDSVAKNDSTVERESWFRAIPVNEFVYRMVVRSLAVLQCEAVQYGTSSVRDRVVQEIALAVSSFYAV